MKYVLVPGAGGVAWYWNRVVPLLKSAGHKAIAVDLPGDDESAGPREYADIVASAAAGADDVVLVAQSMGGFTAPLICERITVRELVLVNAMIPLPGESAGQWWGHVDSATAQREAADIGGYGEFDTATYFLHDLPDDVAAEGEPHQRAEADIGFTQTCDFTAWPSIPIRVLAGADDRFFPVDFQRRVARERLSIEPDVLPGGHLLALANPAGVATYLLA
ncbi:alpha/beta fold hydrolase [Leekyejoonella antrihumi]|uniref:Alpha/beta hydrolase n=1 Tax=Leekyejoonella antrihumi TaxID=1660198 RepID=A0A563E588_9MICO|nr:alpha/beta fold hydrolase [Leekyejoonella antrihumi]TWP37710.1 alpha/beta hydrolase [Leekyejoonella antrihumi]